MIIKEPSVIKVAGNKGKIIKEYMAICLPAFSPDNVHRDNI